VNKGQEEEGPEPLGKEPGLVAHPLSGWRTHPPEPVILSASGLYARGLLTPGRGAT
jgi:hypothetical protein